MGSPFENVLTHRDSSNALDSSPLLTGSPNCSAPTTNTIALQDPWSFARHSSHCFLETEHPPLGGRSFVFSLTTAVNSNKTIFRSWSAPVDSAEELWTLESIAHRLTANRHAAFNGTSQQTPILPFPYEIGKIFSPVK